MDPKQLNGQNTQQGEYSQDNNGINCFAIQR
jgi:hypothetical protein